MTLGVDFWTTATASLEPGTFHLWRYTFPPQAPAAAATGVGDWLSPDEGNAAGRYVRPEDGARFTLRRAFLRGVLATYVGGEPRGVPLERGPRGKPTVPDGARLGFNASHTRLATYLVVARDVGVGLDVEPWPQALDLAALAGTALAPDEAAWLRQAPDAERPRRFLRLWCRKEAALKAHGEGLVDDLTRLSVLADAVAVGAAGTAFLQDLDLGPDAVVALATTRAVPPLALRPGLRRRIPR